MVRFSASSEALSECRGEFDRDPFIFLLASSVRTLVRADHWLPSPPHRNAGVSTVHEGIIN
jgi:hypothetical protein